MNKRIFWALAVLVTSLIGVALLSSPAGAAAPSTATVCFAGDEGWDFSASAEKWPTPIEAKQFTDGGLVLDLAVPPRAGGKQAGYVGVTDSLYNAAKYEANGKLGFHYSPVFGPLPGYQLLIDLDNDLTTYDGILVGESVYGNKWWATKVAKFPLIPDSTGGGSSKSATLQEYLDKYPTAKIYGVGFSLGSGATGYGTLKDFTFGNQTWQFAKYCGPGATTTTTTSPTTTSTTVAPTSVTTTTTSQGSSSTTTSTSTEVIGSTFENCTEVWNVLGRAIRADEVGFSSKLDTDVDGTGCENDPRTVQAVAQVSGLASTGTPFNPWALGGFAVVLIAGGGGALFAMRRKAQRGK